MLRLGLSIVIAATATAHAQDAFEIQVYDVETAPRGEIGLETHLNHHLIHAAPDETHLTFEPHYGLRAWAELGGYFQTAMTSSGELDYAGVKLRLKLRLPSRVWDDRIGLGFNIEVSAIPARFEPAIYGSELRPIADLRLGRIYAAINPIIGVDLDGTLAGHPQLEPAAKLGYAITARVMVGVEAYGAFGPIDDLGRERLERLFGVIDVRGAHWDLDLGFGASWGSPDHPIGKLIFGVHP